MGHLTEALEEICEKGPVVIPCFLQVGKLRHGAGKELAPGQTARKQQRWDLNPLPWLHGPCTKFRGDETSLLSPEDFTSAKRRGM